MRRSSRRLAPFSRSKGYVLLAIVVILILLSISRWAQDLAKPMPTTAGLTVLSGEATVVRADAGAGSPLKAGEATTLQGGDQVLTGPDARVRLAFKGGATTELGSNTRLTLLELYASPFTRAPAAVLALHEGRTLTRVDQAPLRGGRLEMETAAISIQARDTLFQCDAPNKDQSYVAVFEGLVRVTMGEQNIELKAGQAVDARLGGTLTAIAAPAAPSINATLAPAPVGKTPTLTEREKTLFPGVVTPTRPEDRYHQYTVQPGDTLYSIARQFGVSPEAIMEANRQTLRNPDMLRVGQQLRIPKS